MNTRWCSVVSKIKPYTYDGCYDTAEKQRHDICPDWHGKIFLGDDDDPENKAEDENSNVPVPWHFSVVLDHVFMVLVVVLTLASRLVRMPNVLAPEEGDVHDERSNLRSVKV